MKMESFEWKKNHEIFSFFFFFIVRDKSLAGAVKKKKRKIKCIYLEDGKEHIDAHARHKSSVTVLTVRKSALY